MKQVLVLYATVVLVWGSTWAVIPYQLGVVAEEVSVAYRFAIASLVVFGYGLVTGRTLRIALPHYPLVVLTGTFMFSANYLFTYFAINYVTSGLVAVAFSFLVVANGALERAFFRTRFDRRLLYASLCGVLGIACLFWPEVESFGLEDRTLLGVLLTLAAVLLASLGNMAAIACAARNLPIVSVNAHGMAWGALVSLVTALLRGQALEFSMEPGYIISLLYLSLVGSALVFGAYVALLRTIGSARAAYTSVLFPIVALLISTFVEGYAWSPLAIAGVVFVLGGNWLALADRRKGNNA